MSEEIESKLGLNDTLTMDVIEQFLGVTDLQKRIIPGKTYNVVVDLSEDRLYILTKTGRERNGKTVFRVARVYIWSRIVEMLLFSRIVLE